MQEFAALEAWFSETMMVAFTDGGQLEGRLMGADVIGLEFELVRFYEMTDKGLEPGEALQGEPSYVFVPGSQVKMLMRG